jgi:tripartite-type tricarboxylate transporter receptor subunit TctC
VLITRPNLGAEALDASLALVRRSPGRITFASSGIGSTSHLAL